MKKYPTSALTDDVWKEINFIFWRERIPCLPDGLTPDGIDPVTIEASKRGVEIAGKMSFLPSGSHILDLCLSRPGFSSIESVSVAKLRSAKIANASIEGDTLKISVTVAS